MSITVIYLLLFSFLILLIPILLPEALGDPLLIDDEYLGDADASISASPATNAIYVMWKGKNGNNTIKFSRSIDGGTSFETPRLVYEADEENIILANPSLGVNEDGTVFIIYAIYNSSAPATTLFMAMSVDEGETFETRIIYDGISDLLGLYGVGAAFEGDLKVVGNVIYYVAFGSWASFLARSMDGGVNFEFFSIVEPPEVWEVYEHYLMNPSITGDLAGNVYAVWIKSVPNGDSEIMELHFSRLRSDEPEFEESRIIASLGKKKPLQLPRILLSASGNLTIFWNHYTVSGTDDICSLYAISSSNGGEDFRAPFKLPFNEDVKPPSSTVGRPPEIDGNDVFHFLYYREGVAHYTQSGDYFQSFTPVKSLDRYYGYDFLDLYPVSDGTVHMVWCKPAGNTDGKFRLYFSNTMENFNADDSSNLPEHGNDSSNTDSGGRGCFIGSITQ